MQEDKTEVLEPEGPKVRCDGLLSAVNELKEAMVYERALSIVCNTFCVADYAKEQIVEQSRREIEGLFKRVIKGA